MTRHVDFSMSLLKAGALALAVAGLSGCLGGSGSGSTNGGSPDVVTPGSRSTMATRYDPANQCLGVASAVGRRYVQRIADNSYQARGATLSTALPIYFKPTALGRYLLSLPGGQLLAATGNTVGEAATASDSTDWILDTDSAGRFVFSSVADGRALAVDPASGQLVLGSEPTPMSLTPTTGCTAFPEVATNVADDTFSGTLPDGSVLGFADAHVHMSATDFLGGAHAGFPYHRFGVTSALADCKDRHGSDGHLDLVGNLYAGTPQATHDTQGWPTFADWPAPHSLTHESMYYKWVERAWKAGLRIMVNELVENEVLCTLNSTGKAKPQNCNEMNTVYTQARTMHELQDYIDAQEGGPGKGWFRLVDTPAAARKVIADGKLAVILGVEVSHVLNCNVKYLPGGQEQDGCTQASIDDELKRLHDAGVRQIFPVHEFDNALGGNGIFNDLVLNVGNFVDTGKFWTTYDCPDEEYYYGAGALMQTVGAPGGGPGAFDGDDPISSQLRSLLGGTLPVYKSNKRQCNARKITPLGQYAVGRMMDYGMVIDLDHLELGMKTQVIDMAKARKADGAFYPLTSTHGGHGGITQSQARDIFGLGGLIYDYKGNGKGYTGSFRKAKAAYDAAGPGKQKLFAFGYGADANGMGAQADARPAGSKAVSYPFRLFDNASDWDASLFGNVKPMTFQQQVSGERRYNTDKDGMAHYGLVADWVEEVHIEGGHDALSALYQSAEVYLRMWEQALKVGPKTATSH